MNLDDDSKYSEIDPENLLGQIDLLPDFLQDNWLGANTTAILDCQTPGRVFLVGFGIPILAGDMINTLLKNCCSIPIVVSRAEKLPAWVKGQDTLVVICACPGSEKEVSIILDQAERSDCRWLLISPSGFTLDHALNYSKTMTYPQYTCGSQTLAAVLMLLVALFEVLGMVKKDDIGLSEMIEMLKEQREKIQSTNPLCKNPAKRLAGQLVGRTPIIFASGDMLPAARFWKSQLNLLARTQAIVEALPDADFDTIGGLSFPVANLEKVIALFVRSELESERELSRLEISQRIMMEEGINNDRYHSKGKTSIEAQWLAIQFGEYLAYYLAMANEVNPLKSPFLEELADYLLDG